MDASRRVAQKRAFAVLAAVVAVASAEDQHLLDVEVTVRGIARAGLHADQDGRGPGTALVTRRVVEEQGAPLDPRVARGTPGDGGLVERAREVDDAHAPAG